MKSYIDGITNEMHKVNEARERAEEAAKPKAVFFDNAAEPGIAITPGSEHVFAKDVPLTDDYGRPIIYTVYHYATPDPKTPGKFNFSETPVPGSARSESRIIKYIAHAGAPCKVLRTKSGGRVRVIFTMMDGKTIEGDVPAEYVTEKPEDVKTEAEADKMAEDRAFDKEKNGGVQ